MLIIKRTAVLINVNGQWVKGLHIVLLFPRFLTTNFMKSTKWLIAPGLSW